jgi:hypothetical protein
MRSTKGIDPVYAVVGVIVLALLATNAPTQLASMNQQRQLASAISQQNQIDQIKARLANADSQRRSALAKQRYEAGCQMVFATSDPSKFAAIQQGKPVYDGVTRYPLSDGLVICDLTGQTAIIRNGVADDLAFLPDRQPIRDAMERYKDAQYNAPKQ